MFLCLQQNEKKEKIFCDYRLDNNSWENGLVGGKAFVVVT